MTYTSLWKVCVLSSSDSGAIQRAGSLPCRNTGFGNFYIANPQSYAKWRRHCSQYGNLLMYCRVYTAITSCSKCYRLYYCKPYTHNCFSSDLNDLNSELMTQHTGISRIFTTHIHSNASAVSTHWSDFTIVILVREITRQTKIPNLESKVFGYEDITCGQITMYTLREGEEVRGGGREGRSREGGREEKVTASINDTMIIKFNTHVLASSPGDPFPVQSARQSLGGRGE